MENQLTQGNQVSQRTNDNQNSLHIVSGFNKSTAALG